MCDVCGEFVELLQAYEDRATKDGSERPLLLTKQEVATLCNYIQAWPTRQCLCAFQTHKNFERFNCVLQSVICLAVYQLKEIKTEGNLKYEEEKKAAATAASATVSSTAASEAASEAESTTTKATEPAEGKDKGSSEKKSAKDEVWTVEERTNLLNLLSKLFVQNFPMYMAYKHSGQPKLEEMSQQELATLSAFCELHDTETPVFLLRYVYFFCKSGGSFAMTDCFEEHTVLPVMLAQAIIGIVCNLKMWLNYRSVLQLFVPLRSRVLRYLCNLSDKDLRLPGVKTMADFMWASVKDPLDAPLSFDRDGLDLAFKYFSSSTLTMRLAGIAHINAHINMFNELCNSDSVAEVESVGQSLANWLVDNNIIAHIFGPNLHVEVIKQSHVLLSFLAMEGKISNEHIDIMWSAAQLKHCSRQVHDLLPPLIKHLEARPVLHLYSLLCKLEPKDHTEQSLFLASSLIKFIWNSSGVGVYGVLDPAMSRGLGKVGNLTSMAPRRRAVSGANTSSENSVSMDGSNSDDEQVGSETDSSQHSDDVRKTPSTCSEGPPSKQARKMIGPMNRPRAPCMPIDDSSDAEDAQTKGGVRVREARDESRPVSRRGQHLAARGSESIPCEADIKSVSDETTIKQQRKKAIKHKKLIGKPGPGSTRSKDAGVKIQECGVDVSDSDDEETVQRVASPVKRVRGKKKQGLVLRQGNTEFIQMLGEEEEEDDDDDEDDDDEEHSQSSRESPHRAAVLTELASLAQGPEHAHECRTFPIPTFDSQRVRQTARELIDEMSGDEEGSYSSRMSTKSEKNMADFDGEESGCEDELVQLAAQAQYGNMTAAFSSRFHPARPGLMLEASRVFSQYSIDAVCRPGNTLLWDLLQDDKIGQLGEGLALEAEKALSNLLCYNTERIIRMKFIEGCLENLANNRSVVISLRLLPKLFGSFQQFRGMDTHQVTMWAEHEHNMMSHFFSNLVTYVSRGPRNPILHHHQIEVQVRLQFLTSIYSSAGTPDNFRLSLEQVDTLWACLASDGQCSDELASWLLAQARSTGGQGAPELHALSFEALRHLYLHKLPSLRPESISTVALSLFQHLCNLARVAAAHPLSPLRGVDTVGVDHLWKIALRANNTDVSMTAIQYLNGFYVGRQLEQESEFVSQCMAHLEAATADLVTAEEPSLLCIQRALLLLRTHLDIFRRRYAYHLRRWALEGRGVGSHVALIAERSPMRVLVQPAGSSDKVTLELQASDLVAELRAEVAAWWEGMQAPLPPSPASPQPTTTPVLGSLLAEGPIRMITQGQELTTDFDEKTLHEMGFKDQQLVFISMGASRPPKKRDSLDMPSVLPPPPRESLPTLLLLQTKYFEQLFSLMHTLSAMKSHDRNGHQIVHTKAQVLSRRVWDILTLLPTSPTLLEGFQALGSGPVENSTLQKLLDPASPQKLMYSLYIVESLSRSMPPRRLLRKVELEEESKSSDHPPTWSQQFARHGGLRHLFDIFMSGVLQRSGGDGSEWQQDCLATLLKLLCQLGMSIAPAPEELESSTESESAPEGTRRKKRVANRPTHYAERLIIFRLNEVMLQMMDVEVAMPRLTSILYEASLPRDPNHYKTGFWGRAQVVHYAMALLVSWVHSSEVAREALFTAPNFSTWLQRLVLEDPEPSVRREVCSALYRLCLCSPRPGPSHTSQIAAPMLANLLEFLPIAEGMRPQRQELHHPAEDGKEPYGPACRDYFWLLCQLVDSLSEDLIKESIEDPQGCVIDIEGLAKRLSGAVIAREYLEARHNLVEDEGLVGLLNLTCTVMKHNPPFKTRQEGQDFMLQVFEFLFALPSPRQRLLPKCKSQPARSSAYDMLVELSKCAPDNYRVLHERLLAQHTPNQESPYPWDYWPHEDGRSDCGYVGLTNLGATCYMASCMQHLYMMPQARAAILQAHCDTSSKHEQTLRELQRMFAYLLESERKAYNPRSFCKVYQMDHQPLNTGEQKDMAEFFIDLVSKLEEMTPELKQLVKKLFCGTLSNNFVSLDCPHVSRNLEEFYTVRCQVADMRNLYESLDEVTVKDTLEGDNMYTCSQCGKKVRAEKRACFKKLPRILCFNTMRYTFNMVTMLKEKVNTHFSFPLRLDMTSYTEKHLMPQHYQEEKLKSQQQQRKLEQGENSSENTEVGESTSKSSTPTQETVDNESATTSSTSDNSTAQSAAGSSEAPDIECYEYDLIGVTVHTGTADGGHYYSFIRDRTATNRDKWFLFNDAEVKPFDPSQIAAECFGGEMTSKTYDSVTDKFMDFSFEKTNSAYMLFYEWSGPKDRGEDQEQSEMHEGQSQTSSHAICTSTGRAPSPPFQFELSKELEDWIWCDNRTFLRDKNIFEHTYFSFMWQMCGYIPQTLLSQQPEVTEMAAQLSASFFLETFIHAKEKPTMVQWVELLTKQFNSSVAAGEWFLSHMASNEWWPMQILIKCPNQMVRQMFHRLCIHVIQRLRPSHAALYNRTEDTEAREAGTVDPRTVGNLSCVTRFIRMLLILMEHGAKAHLKHLTEYFTFLYDFCKFGDEEARFLISVQAISMMVNFYMGQKSQEYGEVLSDEEEEEEVISLPTDKYKPTSLEKMIALIAHLVEKSRGDDQHLKLSVHDYAAVASGKGFPFLYQQTKDAINLQYTRNLIFALCRWNDRLASHIISMIFAAINKHIELCQPFFKLLTLLTEVGGGPSGLPCFTQLVLQHIWEVAEHCPQNALEWLAVQVPRNKLAASWVLSSLENWVEHYLIANANQRVRAAAASLLVALVPSPNFRQVYRAPRGIGMTHPNRDLMLGAEAALVQHQIYALLLSLLKKARHYTDLTTHGTAKLAAYFALLTYFAHTRTEKLMFAQYFLDLWQLFHPKLSEPAISVHHNKQALLIFWNHVTQDCPENVALILQNAHVTKNIAFNYILADHEDQDVVMFNRHMLPAYYGLLRACCQQSRSFTRQLANHQNIQWAFKNITPYPIQYADAVEELFKLMHLFVLKYPDSSEQELQDISMFRKQTLQLYLSTLDGRTAWSTLISAFRTLIDCEDDRMFVVYNGGLQLMFDALYTLHVMYHEATACHVGGDLQELLSLLLECVKSVRVMRSATAEPKDSNAFLLACKDWPEALRRLATLLNTYNPPDLRTLCIDLLRELLLLAPAESLQILVPLLSHCHTAYQESHNACPMGPYFPRRGHKMPPSFKVNARPQRPMVQMIVPHSQIDFSKGGDSDYEQALLDFYTPYHSFIDMMCRLAINVDCMTEALVNLSAVVGFEAVPLHLTLFPKLWIDIHQTLVRYKNIPAHQHVDRKYVALLAKSSYLVDYVEAVLLDERRSLNNPLIFNFLCIYFHKVASQVLNEQTCALIDNLVGSLVNMAASMNVKSTALKLNGDMRALTLAYSCDVPLTPPPSLVPALQQLLLKIRQEQTPAVSLPQAESSKQPEASTSSAEEKPAKEPESVAGCSKTDEHTTEPQKKTDDEETEEDESPIKKRKMTNEEQSEVEAARPKQKVEGSEEEEEEEKKQESKPEVQQQQQKPESVPDLPRPYPHSVNWLSQLEKTVVELLEIVKRKLQAAAEKNAAVVATPSTSS